MLKAEESSGELQVCDGEKQRRRDVLQASGGAVYNVPHDGET